MDFWLCGNLAHTGLDIPQYSQVQIGIPKGKFASLSGSILNGTNAFLSLPTTNGFSALSRTDEFSASSGTNRYSSPALLNFEFSHLAGRNEYVYSALLVSWDQLIFEFDPDQ